MNERIKDLAREAGYYLYDLTETHEIKTVETDSTDEWITLEKFAEMIVKKCMDVAKYHTPDTEECEYTWLIHDKIKEYFGVEE
jgi:hypothetical protein